MKAFQDEDFLFVQLQDSSNFFQLPAEITDTSNIDGGTALTLDVYSSNQYKRLVYEGLRAITVDGSNLGATLEVDGRLTLLGFFSVNLKTALDAIPATATSPGLAWGVKDALEFFVFGKAKKPAWPKIQTCEYRTRSLPREVTQAGVNVRIHSFGQSVRNETVAGITGTRCPWQPARPHPARPCRGHGLTP